MPATLASFPKGHEFDPVPIHLTPDLVNAYVDAVEDGVIASHPDTVPPMALAALSIRALLDRAGLPEGAVHVGQELAFHRAVRTGETVQARARILSRGERGGWILMGVEMAVENGGAHVMDGRATITFPAESA